MSILKGESINEKLHNREIELRQEGIKEGIKEGNKRRKTRRYTRRKNKYEKHNKNS